MINMHIFNIFNLSLGGTTFVGKLSEEIPVITSKNKYVANLIVDGSTYQQNIQITGEMIGGRHPDGYRAISIAEKLDINSDFVNNHNCQLILIESNHSHD